MEISIASIPRWYWYQIDTLCDEVDTFLAFSVCVCVRDLQPVFIFHLRVIEGGFCCMIDNFRFIFGYIVIVFFCYFALVTISFIVVIVISFKKMCICRKSLLTVN